MERTYNISGMTCTGCRDSVYESLLSTAGVKKVDVDLDKGSATVYSDHEIDLAELEKSLDSKYGISAQNVFTSSESAVEEKSKWVQLRPLFLIFIYLFTASALMHYKDFDIKVAMLDFMGLFFIVFSFFKILDLKGFPGSFAMYDPVARIVPAYGWIYPFLETALGLMFLMRFKLGIALLITLIVLGITTVGVVQTLVSKKKIKCACLGTALNLPMTEATFIENAIMIGMAVFMLMKGGVL